MFDENLNYHWECDRCGKADDTLYESTPPGWYVLTQGGINIERTNIYGGDRAVEMVTRKYTIRGSVEGCLCPDCAELVLVDRRNDYGK